MRGCDGCEAGGRVMSAEAIFKTDQDQPAGDTCLASDEDQPNLKMAERPDWALFRSVEGLQQKAGTLATKLRRLVLKELADNGLDNGGGIKLGSIDEDHYFVEDDGPGRGCRADNPERLKVPQVDHETDVEKWLIDRHRSEKSVPQATVVGSFT